MRSRDFCFHYLWTSKITVVRHRLATVLDERRQRRDPTASTIAAAAAVSDVLAAVPALEDVDRSVRARPDRDRYVCAVANDPTATGKPFDLCEMAL